MQAGSGLAHRRQGLRGQGLQVGSGHLGVCWCVCVVASWLALGQLPPWLLMRCVCVGWMNLKFIHPTRPSMPEPREKR